MVSSYPCGFNYEFLQSHVRWSPNEKALRDPVVSDICRFFDGDMSEVVSAQVEGTFFYKGTVWQGCRSIEAGLSRDRCRTGCAISAWGEVYYHAIAYFFDGRQDKDISPA